MSNQPHGPYDPYDPNRPHGPYPPQQQQPPYGQQGQQGQTGQQGQYGQHGRPEGYAPQQEPYGQQGAYGRQEPGSWPTPAETQQAQQQPYYPAQQGGGYQDQEQHTQTWSGPTWDTRTWQTLSAPAAAAPEPPPGSPGPLPPEQGPYGTNGGYGAAPPMAYGQYQQAPAGQAAWHGDQSSATHAPAGAYAPMDGGQGARRPTSQAPQTPQAVQTARPARTAVQEEPTAQAPQPPMTAAEKARAEGRPQILAPGLQPAAVTAVLAVLLAVAAPLPQAVLALPVVLLQAVTAAGWFRLNGMWPARQGIALAFLAGVVADIGLLATDADQAPTVLIGAVGVWILLVVVLQLRSRSTPDERLYGLTAAAAAAGLAVLAGGHLAADSDAVVVGALAVAVAVLARALPLPSAASLVVSLVAAAGAGVAAGQLTGIGPSGALLGAAAGVCALVGLRVASYDYPSRFVHMTAGVALPLAAAAPVVYVIGRALT
ncbi:hypothetical protein [Streptomyces varsoviensis]|nr:hypothetical protein [Streptomyces varsoviensis]